MKKVETNKIPEAYNNGTLTIEQAINCLWEDIYVNPHKYSLIGFDEDKLSDFLIVFRRKIPQLINDFNEELTDFTTFIRNCIGYYKLTWKKREMKMIAAEKSLENEIKQGKVNSFKLIDYDSNPENQLYEIEKNLTYKKSSSKRSKDARVTTLVLAMKSCMDLDEESISKVCNFTNLSEEKFYTMLETLKSKNYPKKEEKQNLMLARRDNSYYRKRKYAIELEALDENSHEYERIMERHSRQEMCWQKTNSKLQKNFLKSPKNSDVAKILGIPERRVYYCISHIKDKKVMKNYQEIFKKESENLENEK